MIDTIGIHSPWRDTGSLRLRVQAKRKYWLPDEAEQVSFASSDQQWKSERRRWNLTELVEVERRWLEMTPIFEVFVVHPQCQG